MKKYLNLTPTDFFNDLHNDPHAILLDVRTPEEFENGHYKTALNIDIKSNDFAAQVAQLDKQKHYYIYCRIGIRSANACHYMSSLGFKVANLVGGIEAI